MAGGAAQAAPKVTGWPGAAELRAELMLAEDAKAVALTVKKWLVEYKKTQA